ncbi:hypothetical protein OS493_028210 [Desmophyllum pertusum]|uniref:ALOG domain-containing protein n=1 Tax=Desmophyllum pertusum TaxID=174260 RepID=A0A9W9YX33_9CNID|nr:hypothetical protein OS493_028210 [Desmophyllum pertusum]
MESVDRIDVDLENIDQRLQQLMNFDRATSYAKQKDSLKKEFKTFLGSLPGYVTLATVTPRDICRFLVFKDKNGKTQVHRNGCKYIGQKGIYVCGCPVHLSYKTVDSYIAAESRLKSYLKEMKADSGETLHGFRSGCAITLALTGADLADCWLDSSTHSSILHAIGEGLKPDWGLGKAGLERRYGADQYTMARH